LTLNGEDAFFTPACATSDHELESGPEPRHVKCCFHRFDIPKLTQRQVDNFAIETEQSLECPSGLTLPTQEDSVKESHPIGVDPLSRRAHCLNECLSLNGSTLADSKPT
jgi:hypothetical protein